MSVFVGLDCGGSSSRVLAVDDRGLVLYQGHSGAANLVSTPENRLRRNLEHATKECPSADFVCGCFAGLINDDIRARAIGHLRDLFPRSSLRAEPDYTAAFYAAPPETDVCVIAGTGSLVCSRAGDSVVKSGGRGYILGDFGSGYHHGRDALIHYLDDRRKATEALTEAIREIFGTDEESAIIAAVYRAPTPATALAKLAKVVGTEAKQGEAYAISIIQRNTEMLARTVERHVGRYLSARTSLVVTLAGGLWKASPAFREGFVANLEHVMPKIEWKVLRITRPPLYGAVALAKEMTIGN